MPIKLATKIPHKIVLAISGGPDSMALLSFFQRSRREIVVLHIDHGTEHARDAHKLVKDYCDKNNLNLVIKKVSDNNHNELSWRNFRLAQYKEFTNQGYYVCTAHHSDDLTEWFLITSLHGKAKFMVSVDETHKLLKPFLYTTKKTLIEWCNKNNVPYIIDPTNIGQHNSRAILRNIMPELLKIHPGLNTSILRRAKEL